MVKLPASDYFSFRGLLRQAENTVVLNSEPGHHTGFYYKLLFLNQSVAA